MQRKLAWFASFACLVGVIFAMISHIVHNETTARSFRSWRSDFETKVRVPDGENFRQVELHPDRITRKYAVSDMPDGTQQHFWYRPNGRLFEAKTYSKPIEGKRVLVRHALLDSTGVDYLSDTEYSLEGEITRFSSMISPELSFRWNYFPGGQLKRFESFDRDLEKQTRWSKILADEYNPDTTLAATFRRESKGYEIVKYGPGAVVLARFKHEHRIYKEIWLHDDGVKTRLVVDQNSDGTTMKVYRLDGSIEQEHQIYGAIGNEAWFSIFNDAKGKVKLEQRWTPPTADKPAILQSTTAFVNGFAIVKAEYNAKTGKLKEVTQYLDGNGYKGSDYIFQVREDGFLAKRIHRDPRATIIGEIVYKPTDKVALPVSIQAAWTAIHQFSYTPPQVVPYAPSQR